MSDTSGIQYTTDDQVVTIDGHKLASFVHDTALRVVGKAVTEQVPKLAATIADQVVTDRDAQRQRLEDKRANRRNRNRSYTLVVALIFTFAVPYVVANILHDAPLLKYAIGIAIIPDAFITLYAWWRHY